MICNYTNNMFVILQIMFSIFEIEHYNIQFLVMNVSTFFKFFKFIIKIRNKMSLIIVIFLIKHFINFTIKKIDFYANFKFSIEMYKNKRICKNTFEFIKCFLCFDESNKFDFNNFFVFFVKSMKNVIICEKFRTNFR